MTTTPHLHPTTTQRLREFLKEEGRELPPWSTLEEVMDRLREVLYNKHKDPAVWKELATLIRDLQGHANSTARLAARDAEVLSSSDIADIIRELKAAVGDGEDAKKGNGVRKQFFSDRTAATMACLTLLGFAFQAACSSSTDERPVPQTGGSAGAANNGGTGGNEAGAQGGSAGVANNGGTGGNEAGAQGGSGGVVDDASSDPVTDAFQLDSPNEIADALQELINAGGSDGGGTGGSGGAYKGIMFDEIA